jgi:hypothetical protein
MWYRSSYRLTGKRVCCVRMRQLCGVCFSDTRHWHVRTYDSLFLSPSRVVIQQLYRTTYYCMASSNLSKSYRKSVDLI